MDQQMGHDPGNASCWMMMMTREIHGMQQAFIDIVEYIDLSDNRQSRAYDYPSIVEYTMATLKPTILLIPGLWHTPECFDALRTELEECAYETVPRQLPSIDSTDPSKHSALRSQLLLPLLDSGKCVVEIMHSYGGIPGSAAAYGLSEEERNKEGLKGGVVGLIFVASFVIPVEKTCSTCDDDTEHPPMLGSQVQKSR